MGDCMSRTGGTVWEASQALARVLVAQPPEYWEQNRRVVELGCGCGLCGLVAAGLGAHEVVLTDQVLFVAKHNLEHAGLPPSAQNRVRVEKLQWGVEEDAAAISPPFDLLLGGDIMYFPGHYKVLAETIVRLTAVDSEVELPCFVSAHYPCSMTVVVLPAWYFLPRCCG